MLARATKITDEFTTLLASFAGSRGQTFGSFLAKQCQGTFGPPPLVRIGIFEAGAGLDAAKSLPRNCSVAHMQKLSPKKGLARHPKPMS